MLTRICSALLVATFMTVQAGERVALRSGPEPRLETGDDKQLTAEQIQAKLKAVKVTFKWVDRALADVLKDLSTKTGVKITLDAGAKPPAINLQIEEKPADWVLEWVNRVAGTTTTYQDGGIVIK